jgi:hypothetical protein
MIIKIILIFILSTIVHSNDCIIYPTIKMCLPNELEKIFPEQKQANKVYYSKLEKKYNNSSYSKDKEWSKIWNKTIKQASNYFFKKQNFITEVSKENFLYSFEVDMHGANKIDYKINLNNVKINLQQQGIASNEIIQILQNKDKLLQYGEKIKLKKFILDIAENKLYIKYFNKYYLNNKKKLFITNEDVPYVSVVGNVYIPKKYFNLLSSEEIKILLLHEATHLYLTIGHIELFNSLKNDILNKIDIKNPIVNFKLLDEISVDENVLLLLYKNKIKRYKYQKILENFIDKENKEYIRVKLISILNKFLDNYNSSDFIKQDLLNKLIVMHLKVFSEKKSVVLQFKYLQDIESRILFFKYNRLKKEAFDEEPIVF